MDLLDLAILALRVALVLYAFLALVVRGAVRTLREAQPARVPEHERVTPSVLRLLVLEAGGAHLRPGQVVAVNDGATLGRAEHAGVVLADPAVSAEHARLTRRDGAWVVVDLGSTNGTLLNQAPIDGPTELQTGDVLGFGNVRLKIVGR